MKKLLVLLLLVVGCEAPKAPLPQTKPQQIQATIQVPEQKDDLALAPDGKEFIAAPPSDIEEFHFRNWLRTQHANKRKTTTEVKQVADPAPIPPDLEK